MPRSVAALVLIVRAGDCPLTAPRPTPTHAHPPSAYGEQSRPKRERKQVERLTIASPEKKKFVIEQGAGSALGDIDNIAFRLEARTRKDKMLKSLHRLLFRTAPKELTLKADIRKFSGFTYAADKKGAERAKDEAKLKDWFNDALGDLGELLDLHAPRSGTKDAKIKAILDFLEAPRQREGASSLREKKSKEVAKKKRKAERTAKAKEKKKAKAAKVHHARSLSPYPTTHCPVQPSLMHSMHLRALRAFVRSGADVRAFALHARRLRPRNRQLPLTTMRTTMRRRRRTSLRDRATRSCARPLRPSWRAPT